MKLNNQKKIAANILKCSPKRVWLNPANLEDIKEAITKSDMRSLIKEGLVVGKAKRGISQSRARKIKIQKRKGRQKGAGSRKGVKTARLSKKEIWIPKTRLQRRFIKGLKISGLIDNKIHRDLYSKIKGGFFRSKRHIKLYIDEHDLIKKK